MAKRSAGMVRKRFDEGEGTSTKALTIDLLRGFRDKAPTPASCSPTRPHDEDDELRDIQFTQTLSDLRGLHKLAA
jgi:hypothetical protein